MTVSAGVWGYVLQMVPAKLLLTLGSALVQFSSAETTPSYIVLLNRRVLTQSFRLISPQVSS